MATLTNQNTLKSDGLELICSWLVISCGIQTRPSVHTFNMHEFITRDDNFTEFGSQFIDGDQGKTEANRTFTGEKGAVPSQALTEVYPLLALPLLRGLGPLGMRLLDRHTVRIRSPARRQRRTKGGGGRLGAHQRP